MVLWEVTHFRMNPCDSSSLGPLLLQQLQWDAFKDEVPGGKGQGHYTAAQFEKSTRCFSKTFAVLKPFAGHKMNRHTIQCWISAICSWPRFRKMVISSQLCIGILNIFHMYHMLSFAWGGWHVWAANCMLATLALNFYTWDTWTGGSEPKTRFVSFVTLAQFFEWQRFTFQNASLGY